MWEPQGGDLVNWRDLNACPVSATDPCDTSRQPFGARFPQYNHILQLNNDGYSNYNSLQTAFKVRDLHGLSGQLNFVWSRSFDTGSANRGGSSSPISRIPTMWTRIMLRRISTRPGTSISPWSMRSREFHALPKLWETGGRSIRSSAPRQAVRLPPLSRPTLPTRV